MIILLNCIVLWLEIMYYSLFMKFTRKEGMFGRYTLLFTLNTGLNLIMGTGKIYCYLITVLFIVYGLKYIVKTKISLFDMMIILIMLFFKVLIETPIYFVFVNLGLYTQAIISGLIKIALIILLKDKLRYMYLRLKQMWNKNNFYIRYIFTTFLYLYVIITVVFIIKMILKI